MNNLLTKLIGDRKEWKRMEARRTCCPATTGSSTAR